MEKELKNKTISGIIWRFSERVTAQLISFIVSIVLARLLLPEEYGIIAIVTIFINIANVFVTSGLGTSLVQKKNADKLDFSTMFWSSIVFSLILYCIIFLTSPFIARLYNNYLLIIVLRVMALKLPIAAFSSIQQAYVQRKMIFKKFFFATLIGTIISAFIGIIMAKRGMGVWALVAQYLSNSIIDTIVLFLIIDWKPAFKFSYARFKPLFSYGWKIMLSSFLGTLFDQLRGLIIGIRYTSADLAFNNKGEQIPKLISVNINSAADSVLLSSISKVQDDKEMVKNVTRRIVKLSSFIILPLLFGIASIGDNLIPILLTEKWINCTSYLKIVCLGECFSILSTVNLQTLKAIGKSDIILKLEFIKKPIYISMIIIGMFISPLAICIANTIYSIISMFINMIPNAKVLNYTIREQFIDVCGNFIISTIMYIITYIIGFCNISIYLKLILQIIVGVFSYIMISIITKNDSLTYIFSILKERKGVLDEKNKKKN